jgi:UDPglucose 6-dehydrogenase
MKIIIAGYGFVGKAVASVLQTKHELVIIDPKYNDNKITDHVDADGIIICVSTPTEENGICNVNNIASVLDHVPFFMPVMIKSTLTPPNVQGFRQVYENHSIVYSPEFLRANTANADFANQKYIIIGGDDPEGFWHELFTSTLPNCKMVLQCSEEEACMIKYSINCFLALKASYFNQIADICDNNKMDYDIVRHIITQDSRIGASHTLVPGPDGQRGWGGACFPKDTEAFLQWTKTIGMPATLVESSIQYNNKVRKNS